MKVLISGSTGLVGAALVRTFTEGGHDVLRLVRKRSVHDDAILWDPTTGQLDTQRLSGLDAVIHLAGENIAAGRWNAEKKARIRDSRIQGTKLLAETLAKLEQPPGVFVSASAVGYYGDCADQVLDEQSTAGSDFLADVCKVWEAACAPAVEKGIRTVNLRFGMILSTEGGALAKMLFPFKMGVGGKIGSGEQYYSWIGLPDAVRAVEYVIEIESFRGPINVVAPRPVTNFEFTKTLGKVLSRPTVLPMPAFVARLAFGEMADALLLASTRVVPQKLKESGFVFKHTNLADCLRAQLE